MENVADILLLLVAVVISDVITRLIPFDIPRPLIQIALGAIHEVSGQLGLALDPQIFFLLFLPPQLFIDGWRIPSEELIKDKGTVLQLAFGLVIFTIVGMGFFIHWLLPPCRCQLRSRLPQSFHRPTRLRFQRLPGGFRCHDG